MRGPRTVAALYVQEGGAYYGLDAVDPWPASRDARLYDGPHPVVAHPPCERWGRYWGGGPSAKVKRTLGDDGGCFAAALASVRRWGGVIEHPEASHAWRAYGIVTPPRDGRWVSAGLGDPGWTCCVEQGAYGHPARKATWLYAAHVDLPELRWGRAHGEFVKIDPGFHSRAEAKQSGGVAGQVFLPKGQRAVTPPAFRDLLLSIARTAQAPAHQEAAE